MRRTTKLAPVIKPTGGFDRFNVHQHLLTVCLQWYFVAAVAEWSRFRIVAGLVTSSSPVPLKTRRVGQRCTLNLSRAETSFHGCVLPFLHSEKEEFLSPLLGKEIRRTLSSVEGAVLARGPSACADVDLQRLLPVFT
ncbi:hypothetical protein TNCV_4854101 [Trichonephila clavipes]|nr:hypothetical protein TNCV_4854101 [Trichonephila clavipes]